MQQEVLLVVDNNICELDFITIASLGNSQDFGNTNRENRYTDLQLSSSTRGILL